MTANCRWISARFIPLDTALFHVACCWCKNVAEQETYKLLSYLQEIVAWDEAWKAGFCNKIP
jgi:hypothetical protein